MWFLAGPEVERAGVVNQDVGDVTIFAACTAARIGEVSGCRVADIDTSNWLWTVRRHTTPSPGGLLDKGTNGKRARVVPLIVDVRELVRQRIDTAQGRPDARLFTGPRGGRISTAVLRDATHWDEVVSDLGLEHLRRHPPAPHRPDVDGRRRRPGPRATHHRWARIASLLGQPPPLRSPALAAGKSATSTRPPRTAAGLHALPARVGAGQPTIETVFSDPDVVLVRSADLEVLSSNAVDLRMLRRLDITAEVVEV
jgi:hypothetical protein